MILNNLQLMKDYDPTRLFLAQASQQAQMKLSDQIFILRCYDDHPAGLRALHKF